MSLTFSVEVFCNILYLRHTHTGVGAVPYLIDVVMINQHVITETSACTQAWISS